MRIFINPFFFLLTAVLLTNCYATPPTVVSLASATPLPSTTPLPATPTATLQPVATSTPLPTPTPLPATPTATPPAFGDAIDFEAELQQAILSHQIEPFWAKVVALGHMPLIFDKTAIFLYRGEANQVNWRGDFSQWQGVVEGERQGDSDIWLWKQDFERDTRLDYRLEVDGESLVDPLNPQTQLGGFGPNSVLQMPEYVYPEITLPRFGGVTGNLTEKLTITSQFLGYAVNYQVYTPADYDKLRDLPVIYVTDGQDYAHMEMGALTVILDNLMADQVITPVIAVFIDPRQPETGLNRREQELWFNRQNHATFLTQELLPMIEANYRVNPAPEARLILGTSLGGYYATYIGLNYADIFQLVAIQSPYYVGKEAIIARYEDLARLPLKIHLSQGVYDLDVENTRHFHEILEAKEYQLKYMETNDGHSWGNWRGILPDILIYFFGVTP